VSDAVNGDAVKRQRAVVSAGAGLTGGISREHELRKIGQSGRWYDGDMNAQELLTQPFAYMPPEKALDGLSPEDADRRVDGASHSIAEIVAHLAFWQDWFRKRCEGIDEPMAPAAALGWPAVAPGSWPQVQRHFLDGLAALVALEQDAGRLDAPLAPAIDFPPLAAYTRRDVLVHMAQHNSHHLGQVILLRQIMSLWPPPAGSWTW